MSKSSCKRCWGSRTILDMTSNDSKAVIPCPECINKDSMEKIKIDMLKYITKKSNKSFYEGSMTVIRTLRGAMDASGLEYIPKMWLETIEEQIKKENE